jgi:hypothetical protein
VADVYRGTTGPVADELQFERLGIDIEKVFDVDLVDSFNEDTTLRDIVAVVLGHGNRLKDNGTT